MIRKTGILAILFMMFGLQLSAQHAEAYSRLERDSLMIGDQVGLELGINVPEGFLVSWPALKDTISKHIEIVNFQDIDTSNKENTLILNRKLTITSFDSGYFKIPSYTFRFHHAGDTVLYEARTPEQYIEVYTPAVDTTQAFKVIKAPVKEPYTFREALPWILYVGVFEMGITYILWNTALKRASTTAAVSSMIFLTPFLALILIQAVVGEKIASSTVIGLVMVAGGIFLEKRSRKNTR